MEFTEVLSRRKSSRSYRPEEVDDDNIERILQAAKSAASAGSLQAYQIFIFRDSATKELLARAAYDQDFISEAPVCMVFCADPERSGSEYGKRGRELYSIQDATIAASFALLRAVDLGLGTVWVGAFNEFQVKGIVKSDNLKPVALLPVGYPVGNDEKNVRRKEREVIRYL